MSTESLKPLSNGMRAAVRLIADDANERLLEAVRLPLRDDATEDGLRDLLVGLYAAYPQVMQSSAGGRVGDGSPTFGPGTA
ncbi:hypothetical protein MKK67_11660 [Methylobacterium sp. J-072]|uniref:hypothetical protein n=1 Tax=Methylobacterium sp. J-072 TaxID=2836651 RepID=UPI001FBBA991|nr:hypothetical protein [Methylobacterium sp. J-072]MCJ2093148.1 hypothetical protein [Methylobacterium sp. J-072]